MKFGLIWIIRQYQKWVSPWLGNHCRFYPNCSQYAMDAVEAKGVLAGIGLTLSRLSKCHPFHSGGIDVVQ